MGTEPRSDQVPANIKDRFAHRATGNGERDFGLRILRDGTWTYRGSPIRRLPLVKLFATVLRREADGSYWLVTPVERGRILVEDVPFVAVELRATGEGPAQRIELRSNLDEWATVGPAHPLRVRVPPWQDRGDAVLVPYVEMRPGLEARLLRPVFYELVEHGAEHVIAGRTRFGVWSEGCFFALDEEPAEAPGGETGAGP